MTVAPAGAIDLVGIDKRFGAVRANRSIDLSVAKGSIHGIVGENGAGKSTLMKILYGFYQADAGEIRVAGQAVKIKGPEDAIEAGIGMVHQHFMLVDSFTVLENLVLGTEDEFWVRKTYASAREILLQIEKDYGLEIDPDSLVADLPVGLQQRVEILKILFRGAELLILDEPTAVLTPQETDYLFKILRRLKGEGKTVILITHKLQEIMEVTDRVTVMRDGAVVGNVETAETSREELARLMVGREVLLRVDKTAAAPGKPVLQVSKLWVEDKAGISRLSDVSFEVRAGEILGIAGVSGNGQSELLEVLSGLRQAASGEIKLNGQDIGRAKGKENSPGLRHAGLAHVPEDRLRMGVIVSFDASETAILGYHDDPAYNGTLFSSAARITEHCAKLMAAFDVRPPEPAWLTGAFSGGNQQKLVLAREMERDPDLLLVGQPTRGVDIGAVEFIHRRLVEMRDAGKAILLVSAELEEVMSLADRILVMCEGRVVGTMPAEAADRETIGLMMAGIEEVVA